MVVLQTDVTLQRPSQVAGQAAYRLSVQPHLDIWADGFDLECVPLAERFRRELNGRRQLIDGAGDVERTSSGVCVGVKSSVVNLDFVALVDCEFPILSRVLISQRREAQKHTGVVEWIDGPPLDSE